MTNYKKGYILVEVLLGLVITTVALITLAQIATKSVSNSGISQKSTDVKLAAERTMEWVMEYKKRNPWSTMIGLSGANIYCVPIADTTYTQPWSTKPAGGCPATSPGYHPEVRLISVGSQIEARVSVLSAENIILGTISTIFYKY